MMPSSERKLPDACGGMRVLKGWRESVLMGRMEAGTWMETSVENRLACRGQFLEGWQYNWEIILAFHGRSV